MSLLPNWPWKQADVEPVAPGPAIVNQNPEKDPKVAIDIPLHATIQEAKAAGAVEGSILSAPLAPAHGPIQGEPESLVVVTLKNFFETPTWKAVRTVFQAAGLAVFVTFAASLMNVWSAGKSVFDAGAIDWRATERVAELAAGPVLVAGLMALMKKKDNNASK